MFKVIIISHGTFSKALIETAQLIAGEQENVITIGIDLGCCLEEKREALIKELESSKSKGEEVIILSDIFFGSPFTQVCSLMEDYTFKHISGVNLPILLEILTQRPFYSLDEITSNIVEIGKSTIIDVCEYFSREEV